MVGKSEKEKSKSVISTLPEKEKKKTKNYDGLLSFGDKSRVKPNPAEIYSFHKDSRLQ